MGKMTRKEKEALYIKKTTELQTHWGNPVGITDPKYWLDPSAYWKDIKKLSDDELDTHRNSTIRQLRYEWVGFKKFIRTIKSILGWMLIIFVLLGTAGLLLFGIRQLL